jgi:SAM-dependent methyltransferase
MIALANDYRPCGICGQQCRVILDGLFDDRFGAPGTYAIRRCAHCGQEQTWPRPSPVDLKELYERFYNAGINPGSAYRGLRERFFASGLYRLWLRWDGDMSFHSRRGAGRLLDVGCNEGRSLSLYADHGFQVEGLELNETAAALARRRSFPVYTAPLAQFKPRALYDVVVLANVPASIAVAGPGLDFLPQRRQPLAPDVWALLGQLARALSPLAFFPGHP